METHCITNLLPQVFRWHIWTEKPCLVDSLQLLEDVTVRRTRHGDAWPSLTSFAIVAPKKFSAKWKICKVFFLRKGNNEWTFSFLTTKQRGFGKDLAASTTTNWMVVHCFSSPACRLRADCVHLSSRYFVREFWAEKKKWTKVHICFSVSFSFFSFFAVAKLQSRKAERRPRCHFPARVLSACSLLPRPFRRSMCSHVKMQLRFFCAAQCFLYNASGKPGSFQNEMHSSFVFVNDNSSNADWATLSSKLFFQLITRRFLKWRFRDWQNAGQIFTYWQFSDFSFWKKKSLIFFSYPSRASLKNLFYPLTGAEKDLYYPSRDFSTPGGSWFLV